MLEQFSQWMNQNTNLAASSIDKYKRAINTTSAEMLGLQVIHKALYDMNRFELDIAINTILHNEKFIAKNKKGNHMYSNSLKQYRYFVADAIDEIPEISEINDNLMVADNSLTEKIALSKLRIGQSSFRKGLLAKYNGSCVVTGINQPRLLFASHIKPWSVCENSERLDVENGLLLSANMDKLFDCGLITFSNNGKLAISSFVGEENTKRLHISKDISVNLQATPQMREYLDYHRDILFVR